MTHEEAQNLLPALVLGELDAPTRDALQALVDSDPSLQQQLADLRATAALLEQGLAPATAQNNDAAATDSQDQLDPAHREGLAHYIQQEDRKAARPGFKFAPSRLLATAAAVAIGTSVVALFFQTADERAGYVDRRHVAMEQPMAQMNLVDEINTADFSSLIYKDSLDLDTHYKPDNDKFGPVTVPEDDDEFGRIAKPSVPPPMNAPSDRTRGLSSATEFRWRNGLERNERLTITNGSGAYLDLEATLPGSGEGNKDGWMEGVARNDNSVLLESSGTIAGVYLDDFSETEPRHRMPTLSSSKEMGERSTSEQSAAYDNRSYWLQPKQKQSGRTNQNNLASFEESMNTAGVVALSDTDGTSTRHPAGADRVDMNGIRGGRAGGGGGGGGGGSGGDQLFFSEAKPKPQPVNPEPAAPTGDLLAKARQAIAADYVKEAKEAQANGYANLALQNLNKAAELDPSNLGIQKQLAVASANQREVAPIDSIGQDTAIIRQMSLARHNESLDKAEQYFQTGNLADARDWASSARAAIVSKSDVMPPHEAAAKLDEVAILDARIEAETAKQRLVDIQAIEKSASQADPVAREKAERESRDKVRELLVEARKLQLDMRYEEALVLTDRALFIDPMSFPAQLIKGYLTDAEIITQNKDLRRSQNVEQMRLQTRNREASIPYQDLLVYPADWPELSERRYRNQEDTSGESAANRETALKLKKSVPIRFEGNSLVSVVDYLRETTDANIFVNWSALLLVGVEQDLPIDLDLNSVPAEKALEVVLQQATAVAGDLDPVGARIIDGVVTISTQRDLKRHTDIRVYDVRDIPDVVEMQLPDAVGFKVDLPLSHFIRSNPDATMTVVDGSVVIKTTPEHHKQIVAWLAAKREAKVEPEPQADPPVKRRPKLMPVNPWVMTKADRLSTFALDVDTASYSLAKRAIHEGHLPPRHTVRMEEFVNAFDYQYPAGRDSSAVFSVHAEAGASPFGRGLTLVKVGVRGKVVGRDQAKPAHLVFVIDTSGSMGRQDRLPLVQHSLGLLMDQLGPNDRLTVIAYGTQASLLVANESADAKAQVLDAISRLQTGGATNVLAGITLGYQMADRHYMQGGVNRIILCSDGVANVGQSESQELLAAVARSRRDGVTFTSVGVGAGDYDDNLMEQLANRGDGSYLYISSRQEAQQVLVHDMAATRQVIAKDAKIQVDFDPQAVRRYRLIGYENRDVADKDFRNDKIDAGEVGSGQSATALYEVELIPQAHGQRPDLGTVYVRYENMDTAEVEEVATRLTQDTVQKKSPQNNPRFFLAAAAAELAEVLRGSEHVQSTDTAGNFSAIRNVLDEVVVQLPKDQRAAELLDLVRKAPGLPRKE